MARQRLVFDGEYAYADGREDQPINGWTEEKVIGRLRRMAEGDAMTLNARPQPDWYTDPNTIYPPRDETGTPMVD